jgi:hypothetical protein
LETGGCPVIALPGVQGKPLLQQQYPQQDRRGPPWREFAGAF